MSKSLFALLLAPFFFVACSTNNVTVDSSLQRYFDSAGVKGTFGFFDNGQGHFTIYNLPRYRDSAYQPAATFDILQSLIALQTGVVKDDTSGYFQTVGFFADDIKKAITIAQNPDSIRRNTVVKPNVSLGSAFHGQSQVTESLFGELAEHLGKDSLKKWVDSLHYGNRDISGPIDSFWFNNHLKITADEQLGLIKKLYFDQLPFFNRPQKLVRGMMPLESNSVYRLAYKSGRGIKEDGHAVGWVMGWVEENKHPYFFVVNLEAGDSEKDLSAIGLHIVKSILKPMGFFDGKK
jgi:beta-lactamase class D